MRFVGYILLFLYMLVMCAYFILFFLYIIICPIKNYFVLRNAMSIECGIGDITAMGTSVDIGWSSC